MKESSVGKGRIGVYLPDHRPANNRGYVLRYRYVMERKLGRPLLPNELVHHKNGDKTDDREENLEIVERGSHTSHHWKTGEMGASLDYDQLRHLRSQGLGYKRISQETGYPRSSIQSACKKLGI
jgi:hypothetical protein